MMQRTQSFAFIICFKVLNKILYPKKNNIIVLDNEFYLLKDNFHQKNLIHYSLCIIHYVYMNFH